MDPLSASTISPPMVEIILANVAQSKIFNAIIMLLMNIGGKYLVLELPTNLDKIFTSYQFMRYLVIFAICFMATRDIKMALFMALLVIIFLRFILNESSRYCVIDKEMFSNKNIPQSSVAPLPTLPQMKQPETPNGEVSKDEFEKAKHTIDKYFEQNNHSFYSHPSRPQSHHF